jgi:hypothetical protein
MPQPPVAAYVHEPLNIKGYFSPQATFNLIIALNELPEFVEFFLRKIIDEPIWVNLGLYTDIIGAGTADTENIG